MCGRFAMYSSLQDLLKYIKTVSGRDVYTPSYNISPGQYAPAIKLSDNMLIIDKFKWGIDYTYKNKRSLLVNSRIETLTDRKKIRTNSRFTKCVIPANGFYEWKSRKKPFYCYSKTSNLLFLGGIILRNENTEQFSIITRESQGILQDLHHRMPLMITESIMTDWLSSDWGAILPEFDFNDLVMHPISTEINSVKNNYPELIEQQKTDQLELVF